jgi:hypothetical protein
MAKVVILEAEEAARYLESQAKECGCAHKHPPSVPSSPCPPGGDPSAFGARETVPVVYEAGAEGRYEKHIKWKRQDMHGLESYIGAGRDYEFSITKQPRERPWQLAYRHADHKHGAFRVVDRFEELDAAKQRAELIEYHGLDHRRPGGAEEDYIAVNSSGKQVAGPFKSYDEAKRIADQQGGVVKYAFEARDDAHGLQETREANDGCLPWVKVAKDPARYEGCLARAQALGPLQTPEALYKLLGPSMEKEDQEIFVVVLLDIRFQLRGVAEVARGQRSHVGVGVNDVMRIVLVSGAEHFAVAHCHPSGKAKPSPADRSLTKAIEDATTPYGRDVTFLDHIVVGAGEYYSIRENKLHKAQHKKRRTHG